MKYFLFLFILQLWNFGYSQETEADFFSQIVTGMNNMASKLVNFANENGFLGRISPSECILPPLECPNDNITFWYINRSLAGEPLKLNFSDPDSFGKLQKNKNPWKIIIHGYTKSKDEIPNPELEEAYFRHGDYNLITVDYEPLARDKCYIHASLNVPLVANCTAQIIDALIEREIFKSENLHIIGFGLGGQVAGLIYQYMKHEKPNRITALEPSGFLLDGNVNKRLTKDSGDFVDVIHTNALIKGKLEPSGHADFYPNVRLSQLWCLPGDDERSIINCMYERSVLYYAESINSKVGFWGRPCSDHFSFYIGLCKANESDLVLMGEFTPHTARGTFYLETSNTEPYALGKK